MAGERESLAAQMLSLVPRTLLLAAAALLVSAVPAVADPETTGGMPASEPPVLSPQGGVVGTGSAPPPPAVAAQTEDGTESPGEPPPTSTTPEDQPDFDESVAQTPVDPSPTNEPAATASRSGGGSLPHTGFAVAALIAIGTGFMLTGYALRYSRALDG